MAQLFANNVSMELASDLGAADTHFHTKAGHGVQCPTIAAADANYFLLTIIDKNGNREIVKVIEHEAGTELFTVGASEAVPHSANVNGRAYEAIHGVQTALAITASDNHAIKMNYTAAVIEAAMAYSAWAAGLTSSLAELNILDGVTADKDEINLLAGATSTPAASKAAIRDANAIVKGAELNMTGDASASGNTGTTTLNLGTVTAGDVILATGYSNCHSHTLPTTFFGRIGKDSGTADIHIGHDHDSYTMYPLMQSPGYYFEGGVSVVLRVVTSGTLVLQNYISMTDPSSETYDNQIHAFFLKKA